MPRVARCGAGRLVPRKGFDEAVRAPAPEADGEATAQAGGVREIEIGRIRANPNQPRTQFDEAAIAELADSIAKRGVLQPILLRPDGDGASSLSPHVE